MKKLGFLVVLLSLFAFLATGCESVPVSSISFQSSTAIMIDNEALQLGVTISPQNTTERVIFRSSNNAVAVVNASG